MITMSEVSDAIARIRAQSATGTPERRELVNQLGLSLLAAISNKQCDDPAECAFLVLTLDDRTYDRDLMPESTVSA